MQRISGFPNYWIDEDGRIVNKNMKEIRPYWSERDRTMYVNIYNGRKRHLRTVMSLMQQTYFPLEDQSANGRTLICVNADFRDLRLSNLAAVDRGKAIMWKRKVYGETRVNDFYNLLLQKPNEYEFHKLPIDVQEELKKRGDVPWDSKTLGYPM